MRKRWQLSEKGTLWMRQRQLDETVGVEVHLPLPAQVIDFS